MNVAERNRAIKATLSKIPMFRGKIRVRGSRGTGYGWVTVRIDYTPLDIDNRQELVAKCKEMLRAANIDLGFTYTDDTCQYTSDQCHIEFNHPRYFRTMQTSDGGFAYIRAFGGEWESAASHEEPDDGHPLVP